ncbi:hypothetical protein NPIL_641631 [Nephila pilipes]|uniref:DUF4817 domain-containing protein n=1 Tax=Nephila pilipes TaxID=299642 RepID=A0A8X6PF18_NEPPI|nr:hypothetical protein NPIL_641631 [Nephila pilipes]
MSYYFCIQHVWERYALCFVIEAYVKYADSDIASQRIFRRHFEFDRNTEVPDQKAFLLWIRSFPGTKLVLKRKQSDVVLFEHHSHSKK